MPAILPFIYLENSNVTEPLRLVSWWACTNSLTGCGPLNAFQTEKSLECVSVHILPWVLV